MPAFSSFARPLVFQLARLIEDESWSATYPHENAAGCSKDQAATWSSENLCADFSPMLARVPLLW